MSLKPGTRLGAYEVLSLLGAGGMGEVYRARDSRLGRDVAIKILPAGFASDQERLDRFEQEARSAAALNDGNILAVYDIGHDADSQGREASPYIVSELLEGETLREKLQKRPLPVRKAVEYAIQIAHGLAAAHEKGIIHRDLKPENIFIGHDDRVKILDFGLAKLTQAEPALSGISAAPTTPPGTLPGVVLGTIGYMAPEQVRGLPADHRSDIFTFGAILYEMLAGRRAFAGDTTMDVMMAIAKDDPPELPAAERHISSALVRIVDRCLEKSAAARFQSTRDLAFALEALTSQSDSGSSKEVVIRESAPAPVITGLAQPLPWTVAVLSLAAVGVLAFVHFREAAPAQQVLRFQIPPPGASAAEMFTLSRDGGYLAFVASTGGPDQVWVRAMDTLDARALPGTDGATYPFWSEDGAYLGFFAQGKLKKIALAGGPAQTLCDAASGRGGSWNRDGVILFSAGPTNPILRVSAAGGVPVAITALPGDNSGLAGHRFPVFLPDAIHYFYSSGSDKRDESGLYVGSLDRGDSVRILPDITSAVYIPATGVGTGHLIFRREDVLMAQPFDPVGLKLNGEMFPIAAQVPFSTNTGFGAFSGSMNGTLVYRTGGAISNRVLMWVDRTGKRLGVVTKPGAYGSVTISPDQQTVATFLITGSQSDIWLQDLGRDVFSRFTFEPGINRSPIWSPDSSYLAFARQSAAYPWDVYQKAARGNGQEKLLLHAATNAFPNDWSSDGKWIVFQQDGQKTATDLWLLPVDETASPFPTCRRRSSK